MWLNSRRNYKEITSEERKAYEAVLAKEETGNPFVRRNLYFHYPEAVKHYLSLFPNNHICLEDMKKRDLHAINEDFCELYHRQGTTERDILHFINHDPQAYHIIGSIFGAGGFRVGHHDAYLFPEFRLGNDYRADYLLIGKGSGGYEFIFVELERPNGSVALKNGHLGQVIRGGENQIEDWKLWIDSNFAKLEAFFDSENKLIKHCRLSFITMILPVYTLLL